MTNLLTEQLNLLDFTEISSVISNNSSSMSGITFRQLVEDIVSGSLELSVQSIWTSLAKLLFSEVSTHLSMMRSLIIIGILSAFMKNLTESFKNKSVGELGFYVSYIAVIIILYQSFTLASGIAQDMINALGSLMQAAIPLMTSLVLMSGQAAAAYTLNPILMFLASSITFFIRDMILPAILLTASIQIINYLTEKQLLTKYGELVKNIISWVLKGLAAIFIGVISLQRISAPLIGSVIGKTAKSAIKAVPVVGEVFTGAVDTVMYWTSAAKSGVAVAVVISAVAVFIIPIIKIVASVVIYKVTAALIQPICDDRIVKCIDSIGGSMALILGAMVTVIVMFLFSLMIIITL